MSREETNDAMSRDGSLTRFEQFAVDLGRVTNETPTGKWLQDQFLRRVSCTWVRAVVANRIFTDNLEQVIAMEPDRGVLFASNHRSFFDQYCVMLGVWMG